MGFNKNDIQQATKNSLEFIGPQLSTKEWAKVRTCMDNIGGKWEQTTQSWLFPFDVSRLASIIHEKKFNLFSHYQFFETPEWLIDGFMSRQLQVIGGSYFDGIKALEPSAGQGAIVKFLQSWGVTPDYCEVMPENLEIIRHRTGLGPICEDFFKLDKTNYYDLVFANPPFNKFDKHFAKMVEVCKPGGYICTLSQSQKRHCDDYKQTLNGIGQKWELMWVDPVDEEADYIIGDRIFKRTNQGACITVIQKREEGAIIEPAPIALTLF